MAFLHCHNCSFCQDDFWSETWNPVISLKDWEKDLFREDFYRDCQIDKNTKEEIGYPREGILTRQELLAHQFEVCALRIREMKYRTFEEYKQKNPDGICPICGKKELDID